MRKSPKPFQYETLFLLFAVLSFLLPRCGYGQGGYKAGYVVSNSGDTTRGFIKETPIRNGYDMCYFRTAPKASAQKFFPGQIKAYGNGRGEHFQSIPDGAGRKYFAHRLVRGEVSLLVAGKIYYLAKGPNLATLPRPVEEIVGGSAGSYVRRITKYRSVLDSALSACDSIHHEIGEASYKRQDFVEIVSRYNRCVGAPYEVADPGPTLVANFKLATGVALTHFDLNATHYPLFGQTSFDYSARRLVGAGVHFSSPKVLPEISFMLEFWYLQDFAHGRSFLPGEYNSYRNELFLEVTSLKIPVGFKYNFKSQWINPFIAAGGAMEILKDGRTYGTREQESFGVVTTQNISFDPVRTNTLVYWGSIGIEPRIWNKLHMGLELRAERSNGYVGIDAKGSSSVTLFSAMVYLKI